MAPNSGSGVATLDLEETDISKPVSTQKPKPEPEKQPEQKPAEVKQAEAPKPKGKPKASPQPSRQPSQASQSSRKKPWPNIKFGQTVRFCPDGNHMAREVGIANSDITGTGRLDLLMLPSIGGEVIPKHAIPHVSQYRNIDNPRQKRIGYWQEIDD